MINDPEAWKARDFERAGFSQRHTGGGCVAWELELKGFDVWITEEDGVQLPDQETTHVLVGFHLQEDDLHFEDGNPPKIPQLDELSPVEPYDVNGDYFSWYVPVVNLDQTLRIVKSLSRDTFNKEVVIGQNNPDKEANQ